MIEGYYLYCIADAKEQASFGSIGLDNREVLTIPFQSIVAVVHRVATLDSFELKEKEKAMDWVQTHQTVVEKALEKYKTILPFAFGTIIKGDNNELRKWMEKEYGRLTKGITKVRGKAEYGVQIFWYPQQVMEKLLDSNKELKELKEKSEGEKAGTAYMYKKRLEKAVKEELEREATGLFRGFYEQIKGCVSDVAIEKIKNLEGEKQMLVNVSCLADEDQAGKLGDVLEEIGRGEKHPVRFTGPWPPYSFVG